MPTLIEIASHLDMSEGNASSVCRSLGIDRKKLSLEQIRVAYIQDLREKAAGRGGDDNKELTRARIRDTNASADLREIQFYENAGRLVSIDDMEPLLDAWAVQARGEVVNAVNKIVADIEGQHSVEVDACMVDG